MKPFDRITYNPEIMNGKPCIRGMRVTVGMIIRHIAAGISIEQLLQLYPYLVREDITQSLEYATWRTTS